MSATSLFAGIENAEKSTCAWFEKVWAKVSADAPKIVDIADKILPYVSLLLQTVIGAEAGAPAAAVAGKILSQAQSDLDVANAVIYDTGATPTAVSAINAVASNLGGLLTAAHVTNAASVATVNKAVNELGTLSTAISKAVVPVPAPVA